MAAKPKTATPKATLAQRVRKDPDLLKRAMADPGLRSKLPAKYLSPAQQQARSQHTFVADLGDIGTPLTGDSMVNAAQQVVKASYDPQIKEFDRQGADVVAQRDAQQGAAKKYYGDLSSMFGATQAQQAAANATATGDAATRAAATAQAIDAAAAGATQRAGADAATRGAGLDGGAAGELADQQAAAKTRAATAGQAATGEAAAAGDTQAAFLRNLGAVTQQRGGETQGAIGADARTKLGDLDAKKNDLLAGAPAATTSTILAMRKNEVDRLLTEKGLSSDQAQAGLDADVKMADIKSQSDLAREKLKYQVRLEQMGEDAATAKQQADQQFQATQNDLNRKNDVVVAGTPKPSTADPKHLGTPAGQAKAQDGIETALSSAKSLKANMSRADAAKYLVNGQTGQPVYETVKTPDGGTKQQRVLDQYGQPKVGRTIKAVDPLFASVALDLAYDGHISAYNIGRLHDRGVKVNTLGYPTKAAAAPVKAPAGKGGG